MRMGLLGQRSQGNPAYPKRGGGNYRDDEVGQTDEFFNRPLTDDEAKEFSVISDSGDDTGQTVFEFAQEMAQSTDPADQYYINDIHFFDRESGEDVDDGNPDARRCREYIQNAFDGSPANRQSNERQGMMGR